MGTGRGRQNGDRMSCSAYELLSMADAVGCMQAVHANIYLVDLTSDAYTIAKQDILTYGGCVNCTRPGATNSGPIAVWAWNNEMLARLSVDIKLGQDEACGLGVDGPDYTKLS